MNWRWFVPKNGPCCLILGMSVFIALFAPVHSFANRPTSYKLAHPVTWRYFLPTGEQPGWSTPYWVNLETSVQNVWNKPLTMTNLANGETIDFFADYEQTHAVLELGGAISERLAFSVEVPYAYMGGGFLDQFIDWFHVVVGSSRYRRNIFPTNDYNYSVTTNAVEAMNDEPQRDVSNIKAKLKYWAWKWEGTTPGACSCGFAVAAHGTFATKDNSEGRSGTNGENSYSASWHLGIPMFDQSSIWISSAVTNVENDNVFPNWPRNKWYQMYEFSMDVGITDSIGFILQIRADSPILNENLVRYEDAATDAKEKLDNRRASGWNALVHWRGSQAFGFRFRHSDTSMTQLLLLEDWTWGRFDQTNDRIFVHNAPDVAFTLQTSFGF